MYFLSSASMNQDLTQKAEHFGDSGQSINQTLASFTLSSFQPSLSTMIISFVAITALISLSLLLSHPFISCMDVGGKNDNESLKPNESTSQQSHGNANLPQSSKSRKSYFNKITRVQKYKVSCYLYIESLNLTSSFNSLTRRLTKDWRQSVEIQANTNTNLPTKALQSRSYLKKLLVSYSLTSLCSSTFRKTKGLQGTKVSRPFSFNINHLGVSR